ncbi:hypothetical protein UCD39_18705 [Nitrospirillum sp. BR 11752]|uniref:hypothetical protein n=1 Tax=Nitrospirillum sp. BR 11752 TaxID=3104293 RepID=UPI002EBB7C41|nr:hypothetical protein [Nitrospirillum sp. BR 11752]
MSSVRERRRRKVVRANIGAGLGLLAWAGSLALMFGLWRLVSHQWPPMRVIYWGVLGSGAVIGGLSQVIPLRPMPGKTPEEMAAETFFKGPPR